MPFTRADMKPVFMMEPRHLIDCLLNFRTWESSKNVQFIIFPPDF